MGNVSIQTPMAFWTAGPMRAGQDGGDVLTDAHGAVGAVAHAGLDHDGLDVPVVHHRGDLVVEQVPVQHDAGARVLDHLFGHAPADGHDGAAVGLAFAAVPVDDLAHVVDRHHLDDVDLAGLGVDLDFHEVGLAAEAEPDAQVAAALEVPARLEDGRRAPQRIGEPLLSRREERLARGAGHGALGAARADEVARWSFCSRGWPSRRSPRP